MKKTILFLAVAAICGAANATILRVSNVTNSGAPYSEISQAISAAEEGDTIMVDGSNTSYGNITLTKRVVMIGPGYLLNDNGKVNEGSPSAQIGTVSSNYNAANGSILMGLDITGLITFSQPNMVITRCRIANDIQIVASATNCIVHQNYFTDGGVSSSNPTNTFAYGTQITNNIISSPHTDRVGRIKAISDGYIAYNTFTRGGIGDVPRNIGNVTGCTIEHNYFVEVSKSISGNVVQDNLWTENYGATVYADCSTDKAVLEMYNSKENHQGFGAFAGDDPYVVSGIPAGPYISDITVPASVEQGQILRVNVKLGVQQ